MYSLEVPNMNKLGFLSLFDSNGAIAAKKKDSQACRESGIL